MQNTAAAVSWASNDVSGTLKKIIKLKQISNSDNFYFFILQ